MTEQDPSYWIEYLKLDPHPEGGFYKEIYRSDLQISSDLIPGSFNGKRNISTAIYYLLRSGDFSAFHRIKSDELWHLYFGSPVIIHIIDAEGKLTSLTAGKDLKKQEQPVVVVPKDSWFAAEVTGKDSFSLVGCTVAPGFDFMDFEMGGRKSLLNKYPGHSDIIMRLTR